MSGQTLDFDRYVPGLITIIGNKLTNQTSATYRVEYGVGAVEWRILSILAARPGSTPSDLSRFSGLDKAAMVRALASLNRRGLVTVVDDPEHGRRRLARLTSEGQRTHDKILAGAMVREKALLSCFTAEEQNQFIDLLRRLHDHLPLAFKQAMQPGATPPA